MIKTKMKTPSLDQTEGRKERNLVKMLSPPKIQDSSMQQDQEFAMEDNDEQPADKDVAKAEWFKNPERPSTPNLDLTKSRRAVRTSLSVPSLNLWSSSVRINLFLLF
nr:hypothetical protein [Tanacetum cinerariifolium]